MIRFKKKLKKLQINDWPRLHFEMFVKINIIIVEILVSLKPISTQSFVNCPLIINFLKMKNVKKGFHFEICSL